MTSASRGYLESTQRLVASSGGAWSQHDLLEAAQRAALRNTGWPIGVVLTKPGVAPKPSPEGIEARISSEDRVFAGEDFWSFLADASYYVSRAFEEDFEDEHTGRQSAESSEAILWFDVRIWRIAEVLLHSAALYRELEISPDEPYLIAVNHAGLAGRLLSSSDPLRMIFGEDFCQHPSTSWSKEVTQDYVTANLHALVNEIANGVFVLFDFAKIDDDIVREIVDAFLSRSV